MDLLIQLHDRLLSPIDPEVGQLRTGPGVIRLYGKVQRDLTPASESVAMASSAVTWLNIALEKTCETDCKAVAGEMMLRLLKAHPFKDGNGRVSRAIATWLLIRGGYELISDPDFYCRQRVEAYYRALIDATEPQRPRRGEATHTGGELWDQFFDEMVQACFRAPTRD